MVGLAPRRVLVERDSEIRRPGFGRVAASDGGHRSTPLAHQWEQGYFLVRLQGKALL